MCMFVERIRTRTPLEFYWRPPEEAPPQLGITVLERQYRHFRLAQIDQRFPFFFLIAVRERVSQVN